jgi:hypothetical protein
LKVLLKYFSHIQIMRDFSFNKKLKRGHIKYVTVMKVFGVSQNYQKNDFLVEKTSSEGGSINAIEFI